ncbi:MAG: S1C family serine protease [Dehalococcoidia bacterium]
MSNTFSALSEGIADAVEKAAASIVSVAARRHVPASGIVWAPGVIVTADHVLERDEDIVVTAAGGKQGNATIAGRDPGSDLALLRVEGLDLAVAERGGAVRPGNLVVAVGRAGDEGVTCSVGGVVSLGGPWRTSRGTQVASYVRSEVTFYPGYSGGPLIDLEGRVVAVNSSRLGRGGGLSIPVAAAKPLIESLLATGRIRRGYLGIGSQPVALAAAQQAAAGGQETGLLVTGVTAEGPAATGGVQVGDILYRLNGVALRDTSDLQGALGPESVGVAVAASVLRGGASTALTITVGERV